MKIEQRNDNKYLVIDDNGMILLITQNKRIAENFVRKNEELS